MARRGDPIDGVMLLDKPLGMSSNAALQTVRRLVNAQKAGHTGTLDPMATGLLPLCFGNATKFSADLLHAEKGYVARVKLGEVSSTGDAEGEIVERHPVDVTAEALEEAVAAYDGDPRTVWICGGAALYRAALPLCSELVLSRVKLSPDGDVFFPDFSGLFEERETVLENEFFDVIRYVRK